MEQQKQQLTVVVVDRCMLSISVTDLLLFYSITSKLKPTSQPDNRSKNSNAIHIIPFAMFALFSRNMDKRRIVNALARQTNTHSSSGSKRTTTNLIILRKIVRNTKTQINTEFQTTINKLAMQFYEHLVKFLTFVHL